MIPWAQYQHEVQLKRMSSTEFNNVLIWLEAQPGIGKYDWMYVSMDKFAFTSLQHALLFKLTWGGS